MRRNGNRPNKEKIIMLSASGLIITALTFTGIYVSNGSAKNRGDGYRINLDELNQSSDTNRNQPQAPDLTEQDTKPNGTVSTDRVENPGLVSEDHIDLDADSSKIENELGDNTQEPDLNDEAAEQDIAEDDVEDEGQAGVVASGSDVQNNRKELPKLSFGAESTLNWPVVGDVLLNYSMDQTIYFPTLDVYKYNPAIVIGSQEGTIVSAAANAIILDVFYDEEIGNAVRMNIGNGYELTYGQLKDITVSEGDGVLAGDIIGYTAEPTKYYSLEGSNVYVKLTKDGTPVNPLSILE